MDFNYNETQRMMLDGAERMMNMRGTVEKWRERRLLPQGLDRAMWSEFAELGWLALPIPEEAGGLGGSLEDIALLMIAFGRGLAIEPYISTAILAAHIIGNRVTKGPKESLLQKIASGDLCISLAHGELGDRFDVDTRCMTIARSVGDGFVLNGAKTLALDAPSADQFLISASLNDEPGMTVFLADKNSVGLTISPYSLVDGSHAADLKFQDLLLPNDALITSGVAGTALLEEAIDRATIALLSQAVGSMEACLTICSNYLKERRQFGQAIGSFQALQHLAADMFVDTHQARSMLYQALAGSNGTRTQRACAVSGAKIIIGQAMQAVSRTGIQLHGGYGLTDEYAISHYYRRLLVFEKQYGDIEFHTRRLADLSLG